MKTLAEHTAESAPEGGAVATCPLEPLAGQPTFAELPPEEQRRAIARDVIAQLDAERYHEVHKRYIAFVKDPTKPIWNTDRAFNERNRRLEDEDFRRMSDDELLEGECDVCGIGSLFLSAMRKGAGLSLELYRKNYNFLLTSKRNRLDFERYFSQGQLVLIETAFEGESYIGISDADTYGPSTTFEQRQAARAFNAQHEGPGLLRAIMENIVEHGEFRP